MDILFLLIPLSVLLALAIIGVLAWAVWAGQFEDLESESQRILIAELAVPSVSDGPVGASLIHINTPLATPLDTQPSLKSKRVYP